MAKRAEKEGPKMIKEAADNLAKVKAQTKRVFHQAGFGKIIDDGAIDPALVKYVVMMEATPRGLAEYAQKSSKHEALVNSLLSNTELMREMLVADGAKRTKVGRKSGPAQFEGKVLSGRRFQNRMASARRTYSPRIHQSDELAIDVPGQGLTEIFVRQDKASPQSIRYQFPNEIIDKFIASMIDQILP